MYFQEKVTGDFYGIRTRIIGVEGKKADHWTHDLLFSNCKTWERALNFGTHLLWTEQRDYVKDLTSLVCTMTTAWVHSHVTRRRQKMKSILLWDAEKSGEIISEAASIPGKGIAQLVDVV